MYALWLQQCLYATQASAQLFSNVYVEWSKGVAQLANLSWELPVSDERFDAWLDSIEIHAESTARPRSHVVNCAAGLYSRNGVHVASVSANESHWMQCIESC